MRLFLFLLLFNPFIVSAQDIQYNTEGLSLVVEKLKIDSNHEFLTTLRPTKSDLQALFITNESVEIALKYSDSKWESIHNIPANSMKPINKGDNHAIIRASKKELSNGVSNGLEAGYSILSKYLKDDITVYGLQYLNNDGTPNKSRAAFFYVNNKWIIIPRLFKAFQ